MAPEYALNGYLSAKTDVFSFGVLVLEIVSGRKNLDRHLDEEKVDLLSYVSLISSKLEAVKAILEHFLTTHAGSHSHRLGNFTVDCVQVTF